jgi:4,5-dihydroxyphthalate decarboxylase
MDWGSNATQSVAALAVHPNIPFIESAGRYASELIRLTIDVGRYDRTAALLDGRVRPEGIDVTWLPLNVEQIFWRMLRHREFDASEISLSALLVRYGRGETDLVPIPVFLSRIFRHSSIYVHAGAGIKRPEDLVGKRIGVPEYQITAAVWARGLLEDDFGVTPESMDWLQGGLEQYGHQPQEPVSPPGVRLGFTAPDDVGHLGPEPQGPGCP